jgi:hypothetical protein
MLGNEDMLVKGDSCGVGMYKCSGVAIDKATKPPRLYGMHTVTLKQPSDLLRLFAAIATRNTAKTAMNESSSRSHCFAFLTLQVHDPSDDTVRTSRFQFVDLAGNERLKDAHGNEERPSWSSNNPEVVNGNHYYSLIISY